MSRLLRKALFLPGHYNRVGFVNITELTAKAAADIGIAQTWKPGSLIDDGKRNHTEKGFR